MKDDDPRAFDREARERQQLEESLRQVRRLANHLQDARESERRSIAHEIHDELGHQLTAIKIELVSLERELQRTDPALAARTASMKALFDQVIGSVRRISSELRPGLLDDFGLAAAIEWQAESFEERTGVAASFSIDASDEDLSPAVQTAVFRVVQESLDNVARHARADRVSIVLRRDAQELRLEVSDDGAGFDAQREARGARCGITGMRERAIALRGTFDVVTHPGIGTRLVLTLPLAAAGDTLTAAPPWAEAS